MVSNASSHEVAKKSLRPALPGQRNWHQAHLDSAIAEPYAMPVISNGNDIDQARPGRIECIFFIHLLVAGISNLQQCGLLTSRTPNIEPRSVVVGAYGDGCLVQHESVDLTHMQTSPRWSFADYTRPACRNHSQVEKVRQSA